MKKINPTIGNGPTTPHSQPVKKLTNYATNFIAIIVNLKGALVRVEAWLAVAARGFAMSFNRDNLPDAQDYYENTAGLKLTGRGPWRTTSCEFHGGSDSMRINLKSGGFMCMSCGEKGGDVLAYHKQANSLEFVDAAKALNAWTDDGHQGTYKPSPVSARTMLEVIGFEVQIVALMAADLSKGKPISDVDKDRLFLATNRITRIAEEVQHG